MIGKGFESRGRRQRLRHRIGGTEFLRVRPSQEFHEHRVTFVLMGELFPRHGTAEQEMEMILVGQGGVIRIAPFLGIEVEADDEIGTDTLVDQLCPVADLPDAVEESFRLFLESPTPQAGAFLRK